ncbi:MAG: cysteine desulfurase family protein [Pseudomonadota bacterium]
MREARRSLAQTLNCHPLELVFTSGGSEANNLAVQGCLKGLLRTQPQRKKVLLGSIEHPSVLKQALAIENLGFEVITIPVDQNGNYDLEFYKQNLSEQVALCSVMLANNELGVIAPISEMVQMAHSVGAKFHSDLVQALGKFPFSLSELGVDLASFSSHKVYALKGAGLLYVKKGTPLDSLFFGGAQERYRRAGTENLMAIASFAMMADLLKPEKFVEQVTPLRDRFEELIAESIPGLHVLCQSNQRLANTSSFMVNGVSGESLLMNLDIRGFSVGTGAACSSGNPEPSPVLLSIGLSHEQAQSSLRVSLGVHTTLEQVEDLAKNLEEVVGYLRKLSEEEAYVQV